MNAMNDGHAVKHSVTVPDGSVIMSINLDIPHDRIQQNEVWEMTTYDT